jgi:hypothetical protein
MKSFPVQIAIYLRRSAPVSTSANPIRAQYEGIMRALRVAKFVQNRECRQIVVYERDSSSRLPATEG